MFFCPPVIAEVVSITSENVDLAALDTVVSDSVEEMTFTVALRRFSLIGVGKGIFVPFGSSSGKVDGSGVVAEAAIPLNYSYRANGGDWGRLYRVLLVL